MKIIIPKGRKKLPRTEVKQRPKVQDISSKKYTRSPKHKQKLTDDREIQ